MAERQIWTSVEWTFGFDNQGRRCAVQTVRKIRVGVRSSSMIPLAGCFLWGSMTDKNNILFVSYIYINETMPYEEDEHIEGPARQRVGAAHLSDRVSLKPCGYGMLIPEPRPTNGGRPPGAHQENLLETK